MLEEIAVRGSLANSATNQWQRKYKKHAVIVDVDQDATLWQGLDAMGCGVVPSKLLGFFGLRGKYVSEIRVVLLLGQLVGEGVLCSKRKFRVPIRSWVDGVVFFAGWCGNRL